LFYKGLYIKEKFSEKNLKFPLKSPLSVMRAVYIKTIGHWQGPKKKIVVNIIRGKAMDTQTVNSTGHPITPELKKISSSSIPEKGTLTTTTQDTVNLSQKAKNLAQMIKVSPNKSVSNGSEQKKISVSDNNDVVLEVIDPETQEVVRTVPSEEQLKLKKAIRSELEKI
jgi:uncharacterized FlaG/YvyC family protein